MSSSPHPASCPLSPELHHRSSDAWGQNQKHDERHLCLHPEKSCHLLVGQNKSCASKLRTSHCCYHHSTRSQSEGFSLAPLHLSSTAWRDQLPCELLHKDHTMLVTTGFASSACAMTSLLALHLRSLVSPFRPPSMTPTTSTLSSLPFATVLIQTSNQPHTPHVSN